MGAVVPVAGFRYRLMPGDDLAGTVYRYRLEFSTDGINWAVAPTPGEFSNIMHNPLPQSVYFNAPAAARFFRFTATDEIEGRDFVTIGELEMLR